MPKINSEIAVLRDKVNRLARTGLKVAAIGGEQDQPFEQAFSNLAHAYIKDKAPSLLDYEVGFQLLDRNQESTKAIGVFGFKVGNTWLYAPVFFLNGDLKGHELLYIKNQDMFVPMKENWLNYLLNRKPNVLGTEVDRNLQHIGVTSPYLSQLSRSPSKFASAMSPWAQQVLPAFAHIATTNPGTDEKYKNLTDLPTFLKKEGSTVIKSLVLGFKDNPQLFKAFSEFHDMSVINDAIKEAEKRALDETSTSVMGSKCVNTNAGVRCFKPAPRKSVMSQTTETNTEPGDLLKTAGIGDPVDPAVTYAQQKKLRVFTYDDVMQHGTGMEGLTDGERSKLLKDKVLIKDDRDDNEVLKAYEVTSPVKLQNPGETGLYELLVKSNKFEKCLIIIGPTGSKGRKNFATVVQVEGSDKGRSWINVHPSNLWVGTQYKNEDFQNWWKKLPEATSFSKSRSGLYVVIGNKGDGSLPFRVTKEISGGSRKIYDVDFKAWAEKGRAANLPTVAIDRGTDAYMYGYGERISLTGKRGARLRSDAQELYIPADFRVLELRPAESDEDSESGSCCSPCGMRDRSDPPMLEPGNQLDIDLLLGTKTAAVKIYYTGGEVDINGRRMQKLAALIHLVRDLHLREKAARLLLKRAEEKKVARFRIKRADQTYDMQQAGPTAPGFPETPHGYDPMTGGRVPSQNVGEWNIKIPEMSAANTDRSIYYPMGPEPTLGVNSSTAPDRGAQQAAIQAGQTGQKEVFDTAMLGSLLKAVRDDSMVDRYMGDLMKGLDRLGRILFLFYWHNEKFAERYGKNEMVELEDGLRNAFEYLGDIVWFLKQRAIDSDPGDIEGVNLSDISG